MNDIQWLKWHRSPKSKKVLNPLAIALDHFNHCLYKRLLWNELHNITHKTDLPIILVTLLPICGNTSSKPIVIVICMFDSNAFGDKFWTNTRQRMFRTKYCRPTEILILKTHSRRHARETWNNWLYGSATSYIPFIQYVRYVHLHRSHLFIKFRSFQWRQTPAMKSLFLMKAIFEPQSAIVPMFLPFSRPK